jgi:hypothetical protein
MSTNTFDGEWICKEVLALFTAALAIAAAA